MVKIECKTNGTMKLNVGTQVDMGLTSKISWHI